MGEEIEPEDGNGKVGAFRVVLPRTSWEDFVKRGHSGRRVQRF